MSWLSHNIFSKTAPRKAANGRILTCHLLLLLLGQRIRSQHGRHRLLTLQHLINGPRMNVSSHITCGCQQYCNASPHQYNDTTPHPHDNTTPHQHDDTIPHTKDDNITQTQDDTIPHIQDDTIPHTQDDTIPHTQDDTIPHTQDDTIPHPQDDTIPHTQDDTIPQPQDDTIPHTQDDTTSHTQDDTIPQPQHDTTPDRQDVTGTHPQMTQIFTDKMLSDLIGRMTQDLIHNTSLTHRMTQIIIHMMTQRVIPTKTPDLIHTMTPVKIGMMTQAMISPMQPIIIHTVISRIMQTMTQIYPHMGTSTDRQSLPDTDRQSLPDTASQVWREMFRHPSSAGPSHRHPQTLKVNGNCLQRIKADQLRHQGKISVKFSLSVTGILQSVITVRMSKKQHVLISAGIPPWPTKRTCPTQPDRRNGKTDNGKCPREATG